MAPKVEELANHIKAAVPDAEVMGVVGRSSSFEITVDGQLLFSKLESGGFPEEKEILEALSNYKEGDKVEQVTNIQFPANHRVALAYHLITQPIGSHLKPQNLGAALENPIGADTSISSTLSHRELEEWCESAEQECRGLYQDLKETMGESKKCLRESELKFSRVLQEKNRLQKERDNALAKVQALKDEAVSKDHKSAKRLVQALKDEAVSKDHKSAECLTPGASSVQALKDEAVSKDHKSAERLALLQERLVLKSKECEELQKANIAMDRKMKAEKIKHGRNMAKLQDDMTKLRNVNKRLVDDCDNSKKLALEALKQAENAERFRQDEMRKRTQMEERMQFLIREKEVLTKKRYMTDKAYHEAVRRMAHVISEKEEITIERNKERAMRTQLERAFDQKSRNTEGNKETMNEMKKRALDRLNKSHIPTVNNAKHVSATEEMKKKFLGAMAMKD
ncbi:hypothetical protein Bbelb_214250 [Branchiostoma belcheri]|nr:hypothetical protein Bbelb_214250 [Branchiostoma belcheri]